jgi:KTSC domain-containing protein
MDTLMVKVKSSNIEALGHDGKMKILYVKFLSGGLYSYTPVDVSTFVKFMKAKSKGEFFHKHIKNNSKYTVQKVM